jgi:hypothetical protein
MQINKNCKLFLQDVYSYEISSCHYSILKKSGFDVSNINYENKEERNIQIGKIMRDNERISTFLRTTTNSVIDVYLKNSNITNEDLITRQYDGVITSKPIRNSDSFLDLQLKAIFNVFIISSDRNKYIATNYKDYLFKGISNRYNEVDFIYKKILNINFASKYAIFERLKEIKYEVLNSKNHLLYCIPTENNFNIILKDFGQTEISKSISRLFNLDDLNREWYFNHYIRPFTESITIEFL